MPLRVHFVDVFASPATPFSGNPVAVVVGGEDLETETMLAITRWFNLSETTFLLPATTPEADYRLRIFSPPGEMPFAGHPTLGSCHVWLGLNDGAAGAAADGQTTIVQECGAGLVSIQRAGDGQLAFAAPPLIRSGAPTAEELAEVVRFLGIDASEIADVAWIDNGPGWIGVRLASAESVLALEPAGSWPNQIDVGVTGPHPPGGDADIEVRAFFSDHTGAVREDPVTGSLNASVAQWLLASGQIQVPYRAAQGSRVGRSGRVQVTGNAQQVWIGGQTNTHLTGDFTI